MSTTIPAPFALVAEPALFATVIVLSVTSILFILITAIYSSSRVNIRVIKLIGCIFVAGYLGYILKLSNLV